MEISRFARIEIVALAVNAAFGERGYGKRSTTGVRECHPRVAESLELDWYQHDALHPFFDRTYSYEQYFREMIEYYIRQRAAVTPAAG